jgi:potassium/chloride transporter 9
MRTSRLDDDMLSRHASHPSDSEASDESEYGDEDEGEEYESEVGSFDGETANHEADSADLRSPNKAKGSSKKSSLASSKKCRRRIRKHAHLDEEALSSSPAPMLQFDDDILDRAEDAPRGRTASHADSRALPQRSKSPADSLHVSGSRRGVSSSFTSSPVPFTKVASEEGVGPSIMFADDPHPRRQKVDEAEAAASRSIYQRTRDDSGPRPPSGFPSAASIPLSFNDLPSRAQHLILNELMSQNSEDTAVIFTTLPAPTDGMYKSETDSLGYISDLEVLVGGLPPTLLVHSNSMTVTTNL